MNSSFIVLALLVIGIIVFFVWRNKKNKDKLKKNASLRKEKDEVWTTIKTYIREHKDSFHGEIVNHYVVKRNSVDYISKHLSNYVRKKKIAEIDIRKWQNKKKKGDNIQPKKDLYVVCFQTRDTKTNLYNSPEAFECQVITSYISKKETSQKIVITKELNFDKEMEWIAPLRTLENERREREEKYAQKIKSKLEKKQLKKTKKNKKK